MRNIFIAKLADSNFVDEYEKLSNKYNKFVPMKEIFIDVAKSHFDKSSLRFTFNKRENFFKHVLFAGNQNFQLNIAIKHGIMEIMFYRQEEGIDIEGGPLSRLVKLVKKEQGISEYNKVLYPRFDSYITMKEALNDIILLFQRFICCYSEEG